MLDDQVIRLAVTQNFCDITQPFLCKVDIYRIHNGNLIIHDNIGIICHAIGNDILTFKQVNLMVIYTDIKNGVGYMVQCHCLYPPSIFQEQFSLFPLYLQ